ncbi:MAG: hypothetical protein R3D02_13945 [Hyphomicrobiales bacterium]
MLRPNGMPPGLRTDYRPQKQAILPAKSDGDVMAETLAWMNGRLSCVAGRREYNRGRYMIRIATALSVPAIVAEFVEAVRAHRNTACLFVFNEPRVYDGASDAHAAFRFLAGQMAQLGDASPHDLAHGAALTTTIRLACPVTGIETDFDDFECIAFCPQSADIDDPLYDPLMYAPHVSVNMSSDVFGFSYFVREAAVTRFGRAPHEIADLAVLEPFFEQCIERWHKIASATIGNFAAVTDTSRCPVHITPAGDHWIAAHRDPAFAEAVKLPFAHELPIIYARRIVDAFIAHFSGRQPYAAAGHARGGLAQ